MERKVFEIKKTDDIEELLQTIGQRLKNALSYGNHEVYIDEGATMKIHVSSSTVNVRDNYAVSIEYPASPHWEKNR